MIPQITHKELLKMLEAHGFTIKVSTEEEWHTVSFKNRNMPHSFRIGQCYPISHTVEEVQELCALRLLAWSGLKLKFILE